MSITPSSIPSRHAAALPPVVRGQVEHFIAVALRGLPRMHRNGAFGHTLRAVTEGRRPTEQLQGDSLRYTTIVALGAAFLTRELQQQALGGMTAAELARVCARRAARSGDLGAVALAAWAAAEAGELFAADLFGVLHRHLKSGEAIETVTCAWTLTAALAAARLGDTQDVLSLSSQLLFEGQSRYGVFPHVLPAQSIGPIRAHIGCFADQVYPIQAFSRLYAATGNERALSAAQACAARICTLQGSAGQWWWHYDIRDGSVVEGYPVYSVHQHGMAPMALLDLQEAGGKAHTSSISRGLNWVLQRPELHDPLVEQDKGVIWRKVARREPGKAARWLSAVTTAAAPGLKMPGLDLLFPPRIIDQECRPYEFGWLLYAWLSGGTVARLSGNPLAINDN